MSNLYVANANLDIDKEIKRLLRICNSGINPCWTNNDIKIGTQNICEVAKTIASALVESESIKKCENKSISNLDLNVKYVEADEESLIDTINEQLNKKEISGISYKSFTREDSSSTSHASTIVGRRWHNGKCEFLIRDVLSPNCDRVKSEFTCDTNNPGHIWVPIDVIKSHLEGITNFTK